MDFREIVIETKYQERKQALLDNKTKEPWKVYVIKNNKNGMLYIGQTGEHDLSDRWRSHIRAFEKHNKIYDLYIAMECYGVENFSMHLIRDNLTPSQADHLESYLIRELQTTKKGYNMLILHEINVNIIKHIINDEEFINKINSIR